MLIDLSQIAAARAEIARKRAELDAEEADLIAVERFVARHSGKAVSPSVVRVGRKRSENGMTPQQSTMLATIDQSDGSASREVIRAALGITAASLATLLSRSRGKLIETEGDMVRRVRSDEGGADVS